MSDKHILLIEDDRVFGKAMGWLLRRIGYRVTVADSGSEGVCSYRQDRADLVIADLALGDRDGLEVIETLKKDDPTLKFIAISGGRAAELGQAARMGAVRTFRKPFRTEEILEAIDEGVFERRKSA